jgi:amidohydrolase
MLINNWHQKLEDLYGQMVEWRRYFHQYPELSFEEVETPKLIAEILTDLGIEVRTSVGGRGVVGIIRGGNPGKTVALRADFDALPIQDEKDVPYKSKVPGVMHACGHDGHTATLLGVAKVLSEVRKELSGNVVLIHQHAEEKAPGGAVEMIADGCLEGVDAIFGYHLASPAPLGFVGTRKGPVMAAADSFEVTIYGKGGHGSAPHETVDSIIVATQVINQLQLLVSRQVDPIKTAVLSVGSFHAGVANNVISDKAHFTGTVRSFDPEVRDYLEREFKTIVEGVCAALHAKAEIRYERGYSPVVNHDKETDLFFKVAKDLLGADKVAEIPPLTGSEDFGAYLEHVPGAFFHVGAATPDGREMFTHHHPKFDIDERAIVIAGKTMLSLTYHYLNEHQETSLDDSKNGLLSQIK